VGIRRGAISHISKQPLAGNKAINAKDLVVAPGFIDVHSHTPILLG
jgi:N-acyl-D-aspartate/D-glutamate deacylase